MQDIRLVMDLILALRAYGSEATTREIYHWIETNRPGPFAPNWKSAIRATLQAYAPGSPRYREGNACLFTNVAHGAWRLNPDAESKKIAGRESDAISAALNQMTTEELQGLSADEQRLVTLVERYAHTRR